MLKTRPATRKTVAKPASAESPAHPELSANADLPPVISVLIPVYNEEQNIPVLCERVLAAMDGMGKPFEVILVNDGSRDNSWAALKLEAAKRRELKLISLRRNSGQTAALMAAIDQARGEILVPMDADLQNDPADIPMLVAKLDEGFDVVSGWRKDRQDAKIKRNFVSRVANSIISRISGVHLHDYGCTLKAYRSTVIKTTRLYGEMHRFVPIYATWLGAKVTELPVNHAARLHGSSNYGLERIFKVVLDIIVVRFLDRHFNKPIYVFGGVGLLALTVAFLSGFTALGLKLFKGISLISTPLPLMAVMCFVTGCMSILMGLLAEMLVRTYYESQGKSVYLVGETMNVD
jgi:glycosyltransferase involved in cell wall biosynthesis